MDLCGYLMLSYLGLSESGVPPVPKCSKGFSQLFTEIKQTKSGICGLFAPLSHLECHISEKPVVCLKPRQNIQYTLLIHIKDRYRAR